MPILLLLTVFVRRPTPLVRLVVVFVVRQVVQLTNPQLWHRTGAVRRYLLRISQRNCVWSIVITAIAQFLPRM